MPGATHHFDVQAATACNDRHQTNNFLNSEIHQPATNVTAPAFLSCNAFSHGSTARDSRVTTFNECNAPSETRPIEERHRGDTDVTIQSTCQLLSDVRRCV